MDKQSEGSGFGLLGYKDRFECMSVEARALEAEMRRKLLGAPAITCTQSRVPRKNKQALGKSIRTRKAPMAYQAVGAFLLLKLNLTSPCL